MQFYGAAKAGLIEDYDVISYRGIIDASTLLSVCMKDK
jgi:hypothetical protein